MPRIRNPFRVGTDGSRRVVREKYDRLKRYMGRHPDVARTCGLLLPAAPRRERASRRV